MIKFLLATARWLFWRTLYFLRYSLILSRPKDFEANMRWMLRTAFPPWWRFRPFVHAYDRPDGKVIGREILWENGSYFVTSPVMMKVELWVSMENERVVGFRVFDGWMREALEDSKR